MARREYCNTRQHFKIPFMNQQSHSIPGQSSINLKSPLSAVDMIARSVQSMKRFFSTTTPRDANGDAKLSKRQRRQKFDGIQQNYIHEDRTSDDFFVPPQRSRRNGMVFEDITVWSHNVPKSNTLPNRKTVINLSDIDFTRPIPEWMTSTFIQTGRDPPFRSIDVHVPVPVNNTGPRKPAKVIDFVSVQEFRALQDTATSSLSALPARPGFLQETLFTHIMTSLSALITSAEDGLKQSWGITTRVGLPDHFIDAIIYVTAACKILAKALTAEPPEPGVTTDLGAIFVDVVKFVIQTAMVIDALDLLNLMKDSTRVKCVARLTRALEILITATNRFTLDVEATLEMIADPLDPSVPTSLLPSRFLVHQSIIDHNLRAAIYRLTTESVVFKSTLDKLDRHRPIVKRVCKQLDRIAAEERINNDTYRQILQNIDLKREMLQKFFDATSTNNPKLSFISFRMASELAKLAGENHVQAECLCRMANILMTREKSFGGVPANTLLITARGLNSSEFFQAKVQTLLTSLRRRTMSSILDVAAVVMNEYDLGAFIERVRLFINVLLSKYPSEGIDSRTVLQGDIVKGMLRVVRVFHPDKNAFADEEARWVCEEITKVLIPFIFVLTL
jgi:hypothetical protein